MKYWEAEVKGILFTAPTLKALAVKLGIKPSQIEGVYYRKRLEDMIKIRKVIKEETPMMEIKDVSGNFVVCFD
jgi:hypothetical protein